MILWYLNYSLIFIIYFTFECVQFTEEAKTQEKEEREKADSESLRRLKKKLTKMKKR
jgi:hypothetical protein